MTELLTNSDFDINILHDELSNPNIELTFPLPTDKETYVPLESNQKLANSFQLLEHFINFFTKIKIFDIYSNAEYRYSVNKMNKNFNKISREYMRDRLERSDEKLDEIVYQLVDSELRMNLIKAKDFPRRLDDVKKFMVRYYQEENEKNLPKFGDQQFVRLCYITVMKTISKMFPQGVWVNRQQFSNLYKKYLENPMSIILLPNHQSHIDYVILHLIMIRFQMSMPTVVAGDNLNVAVFGSILKGLGAIFIKRSFNNEMYTERNLTNYIEFVFSNKIHFEVFIEGTRSRDGKLLTPKFGILKTLASIYHKQRYDENKKDFDMLIQPISITYERIYEADGYLNELIGKNKKQESFMNILSNGVSNLFLRANKKLSVDPDGFVDNANESLNGKIYVKLADNFTFSSYAEDPKNLIEDVKQDDVFSYESKLNLKKLGFKILHSINDVSYLPESAIVGLTIQTYYYLYGQKDFAIADLLPMMCFLIRVLKIDRLSKTNNNILSDIENLSDDEKCELIESQIIKFFKYTKVNPKSKNVKIINTFELLYYKNLTIHLIIHKCLVSYILFKTSDVAQMNKLYYIFTGILKSEFLFDYDYDESHGISAILKNYKSLNLVSNSYQIIDKNFHEVLATIIKPFIQSFVVCVDCLNFTIGNFYSKSHNKITEQQLINDSLMSKDYPTTKTLLKILQKDNLKNFESEEPAYHVETYNKQYLLSFLFYLNNLQLIKIFKNKAKTRAYVILKNPRDLKFISNFLDKLENNQIDEININYMIDIIDKSFDRAINEVRENSNSDSKL